MRQALAILSVLVLAGVGAAEAAIPVIDRTILTKKSRTQSLTAETANSQKKTKKHTEGIDCAVHEGDKKADAAEQRQNPAGENETVKKFADPAGPENVQRGLSDHRDKTGELIEEGNATRQAIRKNQGKFAGIIEEIGKTEPVKGAADQNAVIAVQNGLVMNNLIETANAFVLAYNLLNQLQMMKKSQQAVGTTNNGDFDAGRYRCEDGTLGRGTAARPCVSALCQRRDGFGRYPQGCSASWFRTPEGLIVAYVTHVSEVIYVNGEPVPPPPNTPALSRFIHLQQETPQ